MVKEGLTVYQPPYEPPRVDYPEPIKVGDSVEFYFYQIDLKLAILRKEMELLNQMIRTGKRVNNEQVKALLRENFAIRLRKMKGLAVEIASDILHM